MTEYCSRIYVLYMPGTRAVPTKSSLFFCDELYQIADRFENEGRDV